jgi:hypothetical protein
MNEDNLEPIEDLLRGLPLRRPSPALDDRVLAARPKSVPASRRRKWAGLLTATATVAAGLLAVVLLWNRGNDQPQQAATPKPQPPASVGASVPTEEVVQSNGGPVTRRLRQQVVREVRSLDRQHDAVIEWRSEQTEIVPWQYN